MSAAPLNTVVIVGRDAQLWLAASVLRVALGRSGVTITAVELPSLLGPADVQVTLPPLEALHNQLRIDESALLRATRGTFSLGQNFADVSGATPAFFHAHGAYGAPIDHRDFFSYWLKARGMGLNVAFEDFSLTAAAAKQGRMLVPDDETQVYGRTDYSYHLPALAYAGYLKSLAVRHGVIVHQALAVSAVLDPETGDIAALDLDGGPRIDGQFFIDASGVGSVLLGQALGVERESWRAQFPADRVLTAHGAPFASIPVYAEVRAWARGWVGIHPSQTRTHVVQTYGSDLCSDQDALEMASRISGLALSDAVVRPSDPGRRLVAWQRNCVALGDAACALDPIHGVDLHATQLGLIQLLTLFPVSDAFAAERAEYNKAMRSQLERVRDFQAAHYGLNRYGASEFWARARQAERPPALAHKIDTFLARGEIPPYEHESFQADSWRALLTGHGLTPDTHAPMIERTPPEQVKQEFQRILGFVKQQVLRQPTHDLYLESFCGHQGAVHG